MRAFVMDKLTNGQPSVADRSQGSAEGAFRRVFRLAACLVVCLSLAVVHVVCAQDSDEGSVNREAPLKALFLYNFGTYVEWPASSFSGDQSPFVIGVLGTAPLDETLNQIAASKQIAGRKIVVQHFESLGAVQPCHILFVPHAVPAGQQRQIIEMLKNRPVLLVGESDGFAADGGDVNFFIQANRIRFEVNPNSAKEQQLKISSKLLSMARIVDSRPADTTKR
jgi:YfiR/HmsC-like